MKKRVELYGKLAEFFEHAELSVSSPVELIDAISCQCPGFRKEFSTGKYAIVVGDTVINTKELVDSPIGNEVVKIVPVAEGEWANVGYFIASMALSYLSYRMTKQTLSNLKEDQKDPEYYFNGPINTTKQGNVVPMCFGGPILVGSVVVSSSITTEPGEIYFPREARELTPIRVV